MDFCYFMVLFGFVAFQEFMGVSSFVLPFTKVDRIVRWLNWVNGIFICYQPAK